MPPTALRAAMAVAFAVTLIAVAPAAVAGIDASPAAIPATTGGTAALAGAAQGEYDAVLDSGETFWRGWDLQFDGSQIVSGDAPPEDRRFQIRRVSEGGTVGDLLTTFTVDGDAQLAVPTGQFSGSVVIQYKGQTVAVRDGVGYVSSIPGEGAVTIDNSRWNVKEQTLTATWTDDAVYDGQQIHLELTSNRGQFVVAVSAVGLGFSDLERIFQPADYADDYDAQRNTATIRLEGTDGASLPVNVTGLTPGTYGFRVRVVDTSGSDRTGLTVNQPGDASFGTFDRIEEAGDIVPVAVNCSDCFLVVGSPASNLLDVLHLEDTSGDGSVTVRMNSRYVGLSRGAPGVPGTVEVYSSPDDSIQVYRSSDTLSSGLLLSDVRSDLGIDPVKRAAPLAPGAYDLRVATTDDIEDITPKSGPELRVWDESDARTLFLTQPSVERVSVSSAPPGPPADLSLGALRGMVARDEVALGDRLVVRVDASGFFGHLEAVHGETDAAVTDDVEEGVDLTVELASGPPTETNEIDIAASRTSVVADGANDQLFVVLDTRQLRSAKPVRAGDRYRITFSLAGISGDEYDVHGSAANYRGYPYLDPGETASVSTVVTLSAPSASVDAPGGTLNLPAVATAKVSGGATVAPGSALVVRATAEGTNPWQKEVEVTVAPDGTWQAVLDFSNAQIDQQFTLTVARDGETVASIPGVVVPEPTTPTPGPGGSDDGGSGSATPTPAGATPVANPSGGESAGGKSGGSGGSSGEPSDAAGPGLPFGLSLSGVRSAAVPVGIGVVGLVVVGGAARYVLRRLKG